MRVITRLNIKIMAEISRDLTRKWSINSLAIKLQKHYRPVYAAVQSLLGKSFLRKDDNNLIVPAFGSTTLLECSERQRLEDHTNKEVRIIAKKLAGISTVFFSAVLFGSSVYKKGRDYDVLIILPDFVDVEHFRKEVQGALGSFYSKTDLNMISEESCYEMLNMPNKMNVMNEVMKNHLVLAGFENFYRILARWKDA